MRSWLALASLAAVLLSGCGAERPPARDSSTTVTVLYKGDHRILGPAWDDVPKMLVFLPLVSYEHYAGGAPPQPAIAASWEHSDDYRHWTVRLQPGLKWHDGTPVTAHDVKFTVDLWKHPDVLYYAGSLSGEITVLDDLTFTIDYPKPSRELFGGWDVYYPKHLLETLDPTEFYQWNFWTEPVGNGPFRFVRYVPETMMEFEANPEHFRGRPAIDRVVVKLSGGTPLAELMSESVDVAYLIPGEVRGLQGDNRFRVYYDLASHRFNIFWNLREPMLSEARVRRALTISIDRRALHVALGYPRDMPLYDGLCTSRQFRNGQCGEAWPHDPESARDLLAEVGWRDRDGDGMLERQGEDFSFELLVPPRLLPAAVFVQQQLRAVGVDMKVATLEDSVVRQRLLRGEFEGAIHLLTNGPLHHQEFFTDVAPFGWSESSPVGLSHPRIDSLLAAAVTSMDPDEVDRMYLELGEIFRQELPMTYLFSRLSYIAAHRRIRGLESPFRAEPIWSLEYLWIEE